MNETIPAANSAVVLVAARIDTCMAEGCAGKIVRHSLGNGQSINRCTRCFRRYEVRLEMAAATRSRLRRVVDEIVNWRE
jgi:hypothetical protein